MSFHVLVKGNKKGDPEAVLLRNGVPINLKDPKEGIEIEVHPDYVAIKFKSAKKSDTGKYEMNLTNTGGTSTAPFDLEVKGNEKRHFLRFCISFSFQNYFRLRQTWST